MQVGWYDQSGESWGMGMDQTGNSNTETKFIQYDPQNMLFNATFAQVQAFLNGEDVFLDGNTDYGNLSGDDKDGLKPKKKEEPTSNYNPWTDWRGMLRSTPIIGGALDAGDDLNAKNYGAAALHEAGAILEMFAFESIIKSGASALRSLTGLFAKETVTQVSVIGPWATYREFAKKIGANFLNVTDEEWTMRANVKFLQGVVERGDDVIFAGKYNPAMLDPQSVLAQEIRYLERNGYQWSSDFTKLIRN